MIKCWLCRRYLNAWFDDELRGWRKKFVEEHLSTCAKCQKEIEWLKKLRLLFRTCSANVVQFASIEHLVTDLKEKVRATPVKVGEKGKVPAGVLPLPVKNLRPYTVPALTLFLGFALGVYTFRILSFPAVKMEQVRGPVMYSELPPQAQKVKKQTPVGMKEASPPATLRTWDVAPKTRQKEREKTPEESLLAPSVQPIAPVIHRLEIYREIDAEVEISEKPVTAVKKLTLAETLSPPKTRYEFLLRADLPEPVLVSLKTSLEKYYLIEEIRKEGKIIWNIRERESNEEKKEEMREAEKREVKEK
ncbi:MAG: anti-sigma factor family protein [bacterium JZ-2024 1]